MKRKTFSILLCAILWLSVLSPAAFAAEETGEGVPAPVEETEPEEIPAPLEEAGPEAVPTPLEEAGPEAVPTPIEETEPEEIPTPIEETEPEEILTPLEEAGPEEIPTPIEEAEPEEVPTPIEEAEPAEYSEPIEETEPEELPAPVEEPVSEEFSAPVGETEPEAEPSEDDAEIAVEGTEAVYVDGMLMDPEDPLYARYVLQLDGKKKASAYDDYTPRALAKGETLRRGIDVSSWQGSINWSKVAKEGIEFVFIRAAYRTVATGTLMTDGRFAEYMAGAKAAGLKIGVYIFSQAITVEEAEEEAAYLMDLCSVYDIDLPLVYDLEHYPGGRFSDAELTRSEITAMGMAFCAAVEAAGYESMIYANPSMLNRDIDVSCVGRLWLAHFIEETTYSGHAYEYWQCGCAGTVNGINAEVDLDFWFDPGSGTGENNDAENDAGSVDKPDPEPDENTGDADTDAEPEESTGDADTAPFADVLQTDWYYSTVMAAYNAGVVKGATATTFNAAGAATRGQVVTMLYRSAGSPDWTNGAAYTDLTQEYYLDAVNWASEQGVVNGYSETEFGPDRAITREELVTVIYRLAGAPEISGSLGEFGDGGRVQSWAVNAMIWAVSEKIINGYEDGTLRPQNTATRAEVCAILMRYAALQ